MTIGDDKLAFHIVPAGDTPLLLPPDEEASDERELEPA